MLSLKTTQADGLLVYHYVDALGPGVAKAVIGLIRLYAGRAGLGEQDIPQISLLSYGWDEPWGEVSGWSWSGQAGSDLIAEDQYKCLSFKITTREAPKERTTAESVIAHEICHLRWWNMRHGREFEARVTALLQGAQFPARGAWTRVTQRLVAAGREEWDARLKSFLARAEL